jgi:hypothetical protein
VTPKLFLIEGIAEEEVSADDQPPEPDPRRFFSRRISRDFLECNYWNSYS